MPIPESLFAPAPSHGPPRLLEVSMVAHRLSTGERFVRQLILKKKLKAFRLEHRWRVDSRDLDAFIDALRDGKGV